MSVTQTWLPHLLATLRLLSLCVTHSTPENRPIISNIAQNIQHNGIKQVWNNGHTRQEHTMLQYMLSLFCTKKWILCYRYDINLKHKHNKFIEIFRNIIFCAVADYDRWLGDLAQTLVNEKIHGVVMWYLWNISPQQHLLSFFVKSLVGRDFLSVEHPEMAIITGL